jgi:hypothetical protein
MTRANIPGCAYPCIEVSQEEKLKVKNSQFTEKPPVKRSSQAKNSQFTG